MTVHAHSSSTVGLTGASPPLLLLAGEAREQEEGGGRLVLPAIQRNAHEHSRGSLPGR